MREREKIARSVETKQTVAFISNRMLFDATIQDIFSWYAVRNMLLWFEISFHVQVLCSLGNYAEVQPTTASYEYGIQDFMHC